MLNAFRDLMCSKQCLHNRPGPNYTTAVMVISPQLVVTTKQDHTKHDHTHAGQSSCALL